MNLVIRPNSSLAIYEQIVEQMKNLILSGELKPGEAVPSIRVLASQLQVSVITTKRAYEELEKENLIRSVAGRGFFVCDANKDYLKEKQYVIVEKRMQELLDTCKSVGMDKQEIYTLIEELWEDKQ